MAELATRLTSPIAAFGRPEKLWEVELATNLQNQSLLWKIPAIASSQPFRDQQRVRSRLAAIQSLHRTSVASDVHSRHYKIWQLDRLKRWMMVDGENVLVLQGNYVWAKPLEHYAVELTGRLAERHPVMLVLWPPRSIHNDYYMSLVGVLRSIAIQILQYLAATPSEGVWYIRHLPPPIAHVTMACKSAVTCEDWFKILEMVLDALHNAVIVIDLAVLGEHLKEALTWPARFQKLFHSLTEPGGPSHHRALFITCNDLSFPDARVVLADTAEFNAESCRPAPIPTWSDGLAGGTAETEPVPRSNTLPARVDERGCFSLPEPSTRQSRASTRVTDVKAAAERPKPIRRQDFKVAILCALTVEADAVIASFDEKWDEQFYGSAVGDTTAYSTGRIGVHNVVVVHLSGMGKINASIGAQNCSRSFTDIRLALVVGICGGVPLVRHSRLHLGDIVISTGVVPFDFGQLLDQFGGKDGLGQPNAQIRSLLAKLESSVACKALQNATVKILLGLQLKLGPRSAQPDRAEDKLFQSTYRHKHQKTDACMICAACHSSADRVCDTAPEASCEELGCDESFLIPRRLLDGAQGTEQPPGQDDPEIYFGLFASGDQVMKAGERRDALAMREKVVAFEMEGVGVWNVFPSQCVIIKGVCDYADCHKNKRWQSFAACAAAACTKAFIHRWREYR